MNPRLTMQQVDDIKERLLQYVGKAVTASVPKDLLWAAADALGSLQFDLIDAKRPAVQPDDALDAARFRKLQCLVDNGPFSVYEHSAKVFALASAVDRTADQQSAACTHAVTRAYIASHGIDSRPCSFCGELVTADKSSVG